MTLSVFIYSNRLSKKAAGNKIMVVHRQAAYLGQLGTLLYTSVVALGISATLPV